MSQDSARSPTNLSCAGSPLVRVDMIDLKIQSWAALTATSGLKLGGGAFQARCSTFAPPGAAGAVVAAAAGTCVAAAAAVCAAALVGAALVGAAGAPVAAAGGMVGATATPVVGAAAPVGALGAAAPPQAAKSGTAA